MVSEAGQGMGLWELGEPPGVGWGQAGRSQMKTESHPWEETIKLGRSKQQGAGKQIHRAAVLDSHSELMWPLGSVRRAGS